MNTIPAASSRENENVRSYHDSRVVRVIIILVWASVMVFWLVTMWRLHHPFPFSDDYNSCLAFLSDWIETHDLSLLVRTYNEAPTLLLNVAVITSYYLLGTLSFSFLAMVASLAPVIFSCSFASWISRKAEISLSHGLILALPVAIIVTQPATWGSYLWATSAYVHGYLPTMALLSFMALERGALVRGLAVAVVAAFFGGAGIVVAALALAYTIIRWRKNRIVWVVLSLAAIGIVVRLSSITANPLLFDNIGAFLGQRDRVTGLALYTLAFIGNAFDLADSRLACALGAMLLLSAPFLIRSNRIPALAVIALALFAGISSAILRFPEGGLSHALLSRYQVYSTAAWSALYALMLLTFPRIRSLILVLALIATSALAYHSYTSVPTTVTPFNLKLARELVVARFDPSIVLAEFPPRAATDEVIRRARAHGVYDPDPTPFLMHHIERDITLPEKSAELIVQLDQYEKDDRFILLRGRMAIQAEQRITPRATCLVALAKHDPTSNVRLCLPAVRDFDLRGKDAPPAIENSPDRSLEIALVLPLAALSSSDYDLALMALGNRNWHLRRLDSPL